MRLRPALLGSLALLVCASCGPKLIRETVYESKEVRVELRRSVKGDSPIARGYSHPVAIADVRIAHILASLTHEDSSGKRHPSIRSEHIYDLAEGIARAIHEAGPDDELAAAAFPVERRLGILKSERVTAFRGFFLGDELVLEFYSIETPLDVDERRGEEYAIPVQAPPWKPGFTLVAGQGQRLQGRRTVVVDWRDPLFSQPVSLRIGGGQVQRRTILMEAFPEEEPSDLPPAPREIEDEEIRALDELYAARRAGLITESEFRRRRRLVLEGRLEEAGYGTKPRE